MCIESWKKEFYPADNNKKYNPAADLLKWIGVLPLNRVKHNVKKVFLSLRDEHGGCFEFTDRTCTLCEKHYGGIEAPLEDSCKTCPLFQKGERCHSPGRGYAVFIDTGCPNLMIDELKAVVERENNES